jgi:hypothetical protein
MVLDTVISCTMLGTVRCKTGQPVMRSAMLGIGMVGVDVLGTSTPLVLGTVEVLGTALMLGIAVVLGTVGRSSDDWVSKSTMRGTEDEWEARGAGV